MDAMAAFGSLVVTEGASAAFLAPGAAAQQQAPLDPGAVDAVFARPDEGPPALVALLAVPACLAALKEAGLDNAPRRTEEEEAAKPDEEKPLRR